MGQEYSSLAIGYLAQRPAVLPGHPYRFDALLGEVAAVEHPHRQRVFQPGTQVLLQAGDDRGIVPAGLGEKALHRPGRDRNHLGQILGVAPLLGLDQQALQIMPAVFPPLLAAKGTSEEGMELQKGLVNPLEGCPLHRPHLPKAPAVSRIILPKTRRCNTRVQGANVSFGRRFRELLAHRAHLPAAGRARLCWSGLPAAVGGRGR